VISISCVGIPHSDFVGWEMNVTFLLIVIPPICILGTIEVLAIVLNKDDGKNYSGIVFCHQCLSGSESLKESLKYFLEPNFITMYWHTLWTSLI
jgi:hypothetical protein